MKWLRVAEELEKHAGSNTSALEMAGGCLVRTSAWGETATESSVFVPNGYYKDGVILKRPTRLQVSETQNILVSEVAAISKREETTIFTLRCGKEIEVAGDMLQKFLDVAP